MADHFAQERSEAVVLAFPTSVSRSVRADSEPLSVREAIGESLREERTAQGRTLADVARDAFVSLPYLSEVERGRKDVSSELLGSISDALELEVAEVLERAARRLRSGSVGGAEMQLLAA